MNRLSERPFTNRDLLRLLIPLIIEQTLAVTVGLADSLMASSLGEAAVSSISLVDTVNVLLISMFNSLATGGAIVTGQYLGARAAEKAQRSAEQMLLFVGLLAVVLTAVMFLMKQVILQVVFGAIEPDVAANAMIYYNIVELSIPFMAIYSVGAALFRVMGNSRISMWVSLFMNLINVAGNALLIFGAKWGVAGVAVPTLASRIFAAAVVLWQLRNQDLAVHISRRFRLTYDRKIVGQIVRTGVPNGIEGSLFQLGKIMLMSVVSTFGTAAIAANAISNTLMTFMNLPGNATSMAMITVISQCIGQQDYDSAQYYTKKLMRFARISVVISCGLLMLLLKPILGIYNVSPEARQLARLLVTSYGIVCVLIWCASFVFPQSLRAAGDTKVVMWISVFSMWMFRIVAGVVLSKYVGLGLIGVWIAMYIDWCFRSICFFLRYRSGKWKDKAIR